jgi:lipopolysaccharide transport system permease protein
MNPVGMTSALWRYRGFVVATVAREFQLRYRGSALGILWNLIQPIGTVFIFTVVFAQVMGARLPGVSDIYGYGVFLCAGMFAWALFAEIVQRGLTMFIDQGNLLKKSNFPKSSLPVIVVFSALLNFALTYGIFLAFLAVIGRFPGLVVFAAVPVLLVLIALGTGLGVLFGTLNVFLRDIQQIVGIGMQFWFWLTPIVYPEAALPGFARDLLAFNPVAPLISAFHAIFVEARMPAWGTLTIPLATAMVALVLGALTFRTYADEIVDEL